LGIGNIIKNLDWSYLTNLLRSLLPALVCITIHEMCHGLIAYKLGDQTAKNAGRLTLNPIRHIDPFGLLMMAVFGFGWAKPVPVNMMNFKKPKNGMALVALAGPTSNMLLALVAIFLFGLIWSTGTITKFGTEMLFFLFRTAYLSICLGLLNLIPIPPLDGSKILFSILPEKAYFNLMRYEKYGLIVFVLVLWSGIISKPLTVAAQVLFQRFSEVVAPNATDLFRLFMGG
jgi:Zn-dependent protease